MLNFLQHMYFVVGHCSMLAYAVSVMVESLDSFKCQDHAGTNKMNLLFLSIGSCLCVFLPV